MVMADSSQDVNTHPQPAGLSFTTTVQITVAIALLNFILFVALFVLYLRAKGYFGTNGSLRSRRLVFIEHERTPPRQTLDRSILDSLPVTVFRAESVGEGKGLECAVCLCELADGEKARFLPKCGHGFHVECIDMWFHSNSTCPLCRNPVGADDSMVTFVEVPLQDLGAVSEPGHSSDSSAGSSLVIDIPRRMMNGFPLANSPLPFGRMSPNSPLPTSRMSAEVIKSPVLGRMGSLRRILSRGNGEVSSCSTPRACDVEYGGVADSKCNC